MSVNTVLVSPTQQSGTASPHVSEGSWISQISRSLIDLYAGKLVLLLWLLLCFFLATAK